MTNNIEKFPDVEKSRRKFGNKVKTDLKSGRIFIAPTASSQTLGGFKNPADEIGITPLDCASSSGHIETTQLINDAVNKNMKN